MKYGQVSFSSYFLFLFVALFDPKVKLGQRLFLAQKNRISESVLYNYPHHHQTLFFLQNHQPINLDDGDFENTQHITSNYDNE